MTAASIAVALPAGAPGVSEAKDGAETTVAPTTQKKDAAVTAARSA
ncbi:hypothetical protein [Sphingomonas morindae]|uniref:Uncharacterized protein n=1 Tax=Sphingomonas morindae TaxID=1541170 RepID=A0ABY4XC11_9SPHN|nr:hypothetical protein [Sphingomonas morindae]USI74246.1 hypothetical protein LHA26_07270 [Sphingomonas morindae]